MRTLPKAAAGLVSTGVLLLAAALGQQGDQQSPAAAPMKFNDVRQVAPGVFFRYSSISATDPSVPFGGCNNVWVVFKDYVAVIDANFPKEAGDVLAAIKQTTDKPVRYVLDTHHHGDHAYGNAVWAKAGAQILGQTNCARLLKVNGPKQWAEAARTRKDVAGSELKAVDVPFDEQYVLDDGTQRIEFRYLGHAHTPGDAVAYLPKHKILCTGDACVNGAFNFMGHSNSASWISCLEKMERFDVSLVCPLHTKRSMFLALLSALEMREDRAVYLDDTGHMSGVDSLLGLDRAVRDGRVQEGDNVLLLSAKSDHRQVNPAFPGLHHAGNHGVPHRSSRPPKRWT